MVGWKVEVEVVLVVCDYAGDEGCCGFVHFGGCHCGCSLVGGWCCEVKKNEVGCRSGFGLARVYKSSVPLVNDSICARMLGNQCRIQGKDTDDDDVLVILTKELIGGERDERNKCRSHFMAA